MLRTISIIARASAAIAALVALTIVGNSCIQQGASDLIYTDAQGRAMDWAGMALRCKECPGMLMWHRDYNYQCDRCGRTTTARRNGVQVEFGGKY